MNNREQVLKKKYEEQGWRMLRGGSPDFVAIRVDTEGNILEFTGVEVKSENGNLRYEQAIYRKLFALAGIPYVVEVVPAHANSDHATPDHSRPFQTAPRQSTPARPTHSKPDRTAPLHPIPCQARPNHTTPTHTTPTQPTPFQSSPYHPTPAHAEPVQTRPLQPNPNHTQPIQIKGGLDEKVT